MMSSTDSSAASSVVSVTYGSMNVGLYRQERNAVKYAPLDRVTRKLENMPENARRTLLAPIEKGFIDPLTVYYMIRDFHIEGGEKLAISVQDFLRLMSSNRFYDGQSQPSHFENPIVASDTVDEAAVPPRLLEALMLKKSNTYYASIDIGHSIVTPAERSSECIPSVPESRPPERLNAVDTSYVIFEEHRRSFFLCFRRYTKQHRCFIIVGVLVLFALIVATAIALVVFGEIFVLPTAATEQESTNSTKTIPEKDSRTTTVTVPEQESETSSKQNSNEATTAEITKPHEPNTTATTMHQQDSSSPTAITTGTTKTIPTTKTIMTTSTTTTATTPTTAPTTIPATETTTVTIPTTTITTIFPKTEENIEDLPENITAWNRFEYKLYSVAQPWANAQENCRAFGGHLVSIHSVEEHNIVYDLHKNSCAMPPCSTEASVWIGLNDIGNESNFVWTDGSKNDNFDFWNIATGEPSNGVIQMSHNTIWNNGPENCAIQAGHDGNWYDEPCDDANKSICKRCRCFDCTVSCLTQADVSEGNA